MICSYVLFEVQLRKLEGQLVNTERISESVTDMEKSLEGLTSLRKLLSDDIPKLVKQMQKTTTGKTIIDEQRDKCFGNVNSNLVN